MKVITNKIKYAYDTQKNKPQKVKANTVFKNGLSPRFLIFSLLKP